MEEADGGVFHGPIVPGPASLEIEWRISYSQWCNQALQWLRDSCCRASARGDFEGPFPFGREPSGECDGPQHPFAFEPSFAQWSEDEDK